MNTNKPNTNSARGSGVKPAGRGRRMRSNAAPTPQNEAPGVAPGEAFGKAIGTAIGAAVDTVVGVAAGLAAKGTATGKMAEQKLAAMIDPVREEEYWRQNYKGRPYYRKGASYTEYEPAYRYGIQNAMKNAGKRFEDNMDKMEAGWKKVQGKTTLSWEHAKDAVRDAWERAAASLK